MLHLPSGSTSVKVYALTSNQVLDVPASAFLTPNIPGTTYSDTPCLSFLIEHCDSHGVVTRLLFDLGIRKDWKNLPPKTASMIEEMGITIVTSHDVADRLQAHEVDLASINGIIFSHCHFDHIGDATRFPQAVRIIAGPGFKSVALPGYPADLDSMVCGDAFENRDVHEVDFSRSDLSIASLPAIDWFGDGSFYLLHTPGHAIGHVSALARTTSKSPSGLDDTFVLLAGDVCHHSGELRPHAGHPLPATFSGDSGNDKYKPVTEYLSIHPKHSSTCPFYLPSHGGFNMDAEQMQESARKVALLDADCRVFVILAHDHWLLSLVDQFPNAINVWKDAGWAEKSSVISIDSNTDHWL